MGVSKKTPQGHVQTVRLGAGAGFSRDRIDPAVELARHGNLDYLVFESLGERTVAQGHLRHQSAQDTGFDPLLVARIDAVIESTLAHGTTIITNGGSAHPLAAAEAVRKALSCKDLSRSVRIAVVTGDDVVDSVRHLDPIIWETGAAVSATDDPLVSANAYIGAEALLPALSTGADIIIAGRCADPSLYLAPLMHEFGWRDSDLDFIARGTCVGHLLECAGQLTGGYFADPLTKPVQGLARLGFPFADVDQKGNAWVGKLSNSGGTVDTRTCREQLLYEVQDPSAYLTPDVTADFTTVTLTDAGEDRVHVAGASGHQRPSTLKVSLGFDGGWIGDGEITYCGLRARSRAELAAEVVTQRLHEVHQIATEELTVEFIGMGSAFRSSPASAPSAEPQEVRLRVSGRFATQSQAQLVGWEVESLYTNGPAGGGGARSHAEKVIAIRSASIARNAISTAVETLEVPA